MQIITITGASGSGKTHLERALCNSFDFHRAVSFTTREKRVGEVDGVDYHFVSKEFLASLGEGLIEKVSFHGHDYGLLSSEFDHGKPVVAVVEPNGLVQINGIM